MPYTRHQVAKVAGPASTIITPLQARDLLSAPSGERPRVYGLFEGAILAYPSTDSLDTRPTPHLWVATVYSTIRKA